MLAQNNVVINNTDWIVVGCLGKAHGIKGFISVHSFTNPRENLLKLNDWHVFINKEWQPLQILKIEVTVKNILLQIKDYTEREQLSFFVNAKIAVNKTQLPTLASGQYYWYELVGMQIINQSNVILGAVKEIIATGANDVLVIEGSKRHLIPYLPGDVITDIDHKRGVITVVWDENF